MWTYNYSDELYHHGIKGQKWGVRRYQNKDGTLTAAGRKRTSYRSNSISAVRARRANDKIDESFKNWTDNTKKRDNAIEAGKKRNKVRIAYESDKNNKELRSEYRSSNKEYKRALKQNTTYRKGVVRQEVGKDASRKYLSEAKKVEKQLKQNPNDKALKKKYADLMSKHDVERAKARKAKDVGEARSRKKAALKRSLTMSVKAATTAAAIGLGTAAVNKYMSSHNYTLNNKPIQFDAEKVSKYIKIAKKYMDYAKYMY